MTESEWLTCTDPFDMVQLPEAHSSERKLRLFVIACCRRIWHLLSKQHGKAVEIAERFAEGEVSAAELAQTLARANTRHNKAINQLRGARTAANRKGEAIGPSLKSQAPFEAFQAVFYACSASDSLVSSFSSFAGRYRNGNLLAMRGVDGAAHAVAYWSTPDGESAENEAALASERAEQCRLLREIIGNPFRPLALSPSWLSWKDGVVVRLAQAAYEDRHLPAGTLSNIRLAVLADALEEAGCGDERILGHLRDGGEHYRGCFVVDALLGK